MDPISAKKAISDNGNNPTNNPRIDLLHNTGSNEQLAGVAGTYGPEPKFEPAPLEPAATSRTQPSVAPQSAQAYVKAAESTKPAAPVAIPEPAPAPRPSHTPLPAESAQGRSKAPVIIGVLVVIFLLALAGGVYWWLSHRSSSPTAQQPSGPALTPVTPTNLAQKGNEAVGQGDATNSKTVTFTFSVPTQAATGSLTPEIEIEPAGTAFTGTPSVTGTGVKANGGTLQVSVPSANLADGAYHWQARDSVGGQHSSWAVFGGDPSATAFTVDTAAPGAPVVSAIGGAVIANPTTVTSNQPSMTGTAEPDSTVKVSVAPDSQTFTATTDASGKWTVNASTAIPNGQHQLSITATDTAGNVSSATNVALTINPATAAQTAPVSGATGTPAAPSTPAASSHLANTGDNTNLISALCLAAMAMAAGGLIWIRRRYAVR